MWTMIYGFLKGRLIKVLFRVVNKSWEEIQEIMKPIVEGLNSKDISNSDKRELALKETKAILDAKKILYKDNFLMWLLAVIIEELKK